MRGGGWFRYMHGFEAKAKPNVSRRLLLRVLHYARPYHRQIAAMLVTILGTTGLGLINPLIFRHILDVAIPEKDIGRLSLLALGLVTIPIISGGIRIVQRKIKCLDRRRRDLRFARLALPPSAANVPAFLHQHQNRAS